MCMCVRDMRKVEVVPSLPSDISSLFIPSSFSLFPLLVSSSVSFDFPPFSFVSISSSSHRHVPSSLSLRLLLPLPSRRSSTRQACLFQCAPQRRMHINQAYLMMSRAPRSPQMEAAGCLGLLTLTAAFFFFHNVCVLSCSGHTHTHTCHHVTARRGTHTGSAVVCHCSNLPPSVERSAAPLNPPHLPVSDTESLIAPQRTPGGLCWLKKKKKKEVVYLQCEEINFPPGKNGQMHATGPLKLGDVSPGGA